MFLLNRNISQLRFSCGLHTLDLKATLPNLLGLLQGKGYQTLFDHLMKQNVENLKGPQNTAKMQENSPLLSESYEASLNLRDPILESLSREYLSDCGSSMKSTPKTRHRRLSDLGPGLSESLTISEPLHIFDDGFAENNASDKCDGSAYSSIEENACDCNDSLNNSNKESLDVTVKGCSYKTDAKYQKNANLLIDESSKQERPEENKLDVSSPVPLVQRTNALRNTKSFNLVEPKL